MKSPRVKHPIFDVELDAEEQELSDAMDHALDKGKLKSIPNIEKELMFARETAANYFNNHPRTFVPLSEKDKNKLQREAKRKGLPYNELIANILHEYAIAH